MSTICALGVVNVGWRYPNRNWPYIWKTFEEKSIVGKFVGYSELPIGWIVYLPDHRSIVVSVNVIFDEQIPLRNEDYYSEITDKMTNNFSENVSCHVSDY
jgi:hypothetical protein